MTILHPRSSAFICGFARARRGMTLLELLIALGLMLALLGALFGFFFNTIESRKRVLEITAQHRAAAGLIERIENDLVFTIAGDSRFGAGVSGDESSIRILTRGVPVNLAERGAGEPAAFADLQLAEYRFSRSRGIEGRRSNGGDAMDGREFAPFGESIYRVHFRYHDGDDWRGSYDSFDAGRLPVAVEVAVWFEPWPGAPEDEDDFVDEFEDLSGVDRERLTFDPQGTFDESEWVRRADRDVFGEQFPPPDRVRVIVIPDAREEAG